MQAVNYFLFLWKLQDILSVIGTAPLQYYSKGTRRSSNCSPKDTNFHLIALKQTQFIWFVNADFAEHVWNASIAQKCNFIARAKKDLLQNKCFLLLWSFSVHIYLYVC